MPPRRQIRPHWRFPGTAAPDEEQALATTAEHLKCKECGRTYPLEALFVCDFCFGPLEVSYDYEKIRRRATKERIAHGPPSLWRYADFLPVNNKPVVDLQAGYTPLIKADRLAAELGLKKLWVKNDTANPTHSFKDRVVSVALQRARELGFEVVACASTGNLANSVAAHAAASGTEAFVFVPANLEIQKIIATAIYGVNVVKVRGNYDDVNRLCTEIASEKKWAFVNVNVRPYYAEGSKTLAYRDRRAAGLAGARQGRDAGGVGFAADQDTQGFLGTGRGRTYPAQGAGGTRRPGAGLRPGGGGLRRRRRAREAGQARHHRQVAGHRQPGGRHLRAGSSARDRRLHRERHRAGDRRRHQAAGGDNRHLHRDGRRRHHRGAGQAGGVRQDLSRRRDRAVHHRRRPEDARRRRGHHQHFRDRPELSPSSKKKFWETSYNVARLE